MDVKGQIPGCFGEMDKKFAIHPSDEERAFDLLTRLRKDGKGWKDTRTLIKDYLESEDVSPTQISEELERARRMLKPWLID
jgi:hypothetical protein